MWLEGIMYSYSANDIKRKLTDKGCETSSTDEKELLENRQRTEAAGDTLSQRLHLFTPL